MKIICILGLIGSGKDEVANYLEKKYGYKKIVMGDIVREFSRKEGLEPTRENLQTVQKKYRDKYGQLFFSDEVVRRTKGNKWEKAVIVGSRRPEETKFFKEHFGKDILMLLIEAEPEKRFRRLEKRGRENDPKTFEEFQKQDRNEFVCFEFDRSFRHADYKIENNGNFEELYKKIDSLLKRLGWGNI